MVTGVPVYKSRSLQMDYNTIFVGMDVQPLFIQALFGDLCWKS